ncbi:hypothetical protein GQ600_18211 [Phytophthora cactorum]|nr:hypothetical protein GQ600_18211 [Phytophthora cactorum]
MTDNIPSYVREGVKQRWLENSASPPDQLSVELPGYYSKIRIPSDQGYIFEPQFWFQVDNRETPVHVDHGRVVSYIPSAWHCFKVWYPGDVVYLNNLVQYSVLLGYQLPETAEIDKWGQFLEKL